MTPTSLLLSPSLPGDTALRVRSGRPVEPATPSAESAAAKARVYQDEKSGRFVTTFPTPDGAGLTQWPTPRALMFSREVVAYFQSLQTVGADEHDV